jgi:hypothetical protein
MVLIWFIAGTKYVYSLRVLILLVIYLFRLLLLTVLPLTSLTTIHLNPKAKLNTINILPLTLSLYQPIRISRKADDS